ncbi:MAG TPA: MFS transporter [Aliidongia sp.]|nr:MFS transporter [Aliidongia sp.]
MTAPAHSVAAADLILRHRPFMLFWSARGFGSMAYQIQGVAVGWQVYDLTHDPLSLGLVGLAQFLPALLLALPAGHIVDRYPRRTVYRLCLAIEALGALLLGLGSIIGGLGVVGIYAIAALFGAARAFEHPASSSLLPGLVSRQSFGRAVAWNSSVGQTATLIGPMLGGLLYAFGPAAAYAGCALGFVAAGLLIAAVPKPAPTQTAAKPTLRSVFAGLAFIRAERAILGAISLDLFAVLLGGTVALLPIYARDILDAGPLGLGLLRSAPALGGLGIGMILAFFPLARHAGWTMFAAVATFGLATCVFAISHDFALSCAALAVLGGADMISVFVRASFVQLSTPDAMRGRVSAVNAIFIGTSNQLGEFESGVTAAWFGAEAAVLIGGIGTLAVVAIWLVLFPELRRIDRLVSKP